MEIKRKTKQTELIRISREIARRFIEDYNNDPSRKLAERIGLSDKQVQIFLRKYQLHENNRMTVLADSKTGQFLELSTHEVTREVARGIHLLRNHYGVHYK